MSAPGPPLALLPSECKQARGTKCKSWLHHVQDDLLRLRASHHSSGSSPTPGAGLQMRVNNVKSSPQTGAVKACVAKARRD
eukprot:7170646-Pyramimonas_sp.AAC.1